MVGCLVNLRIPRLRILSLLGVEHAGAPSEKCRSVNARLARMREHQMRIRPLRLDFGDAVVQVVAVFLGVVCAFAVNAWQAQSTERALLKTTMASIVGEIESNQQSLRVVRGQHAKSARALRSLIIASRKDRFVSDEDLLRTLRADRFGTNVPLDIAWQLAQSDQGLSLLSFENRYTLAEVYQVQAICYASEKQLGDSMLSIPQSPTNNYFVEALDLADQANVVVLAESQLDGLYTKALRKVR